ncbi:MAG: aspartate aminotransferase family protein [Bacteriovoracaceae bacterium]|nr:aspartate aminotransferase family protein [Bacteriovoracaceae bacterium]
MYKLEEMNDISATDLNKSFSNYINSPLSSIYKMLGLDHFDYSYAIGSYIYLKNGDKILDFTSSCGALNLGHNHPEIKKAEEFCLQNDIVEMLKFGNNKLQAMLANNIAEILPDNLDISFFAVSGAEANEAALKLAKRAQPSYKKFYVRTTGSFHGKTHGILPFTESENFNTGFHVGVNPDNVLTIPFNDINALKNLIKKYTDDGDNKIIALMVEPLQGQEICSAEHGYLRQITEVCQNNNILTIFDEIKVGLGRTGKLFTFLHEANCVPDILTFSKSLGGGRRAISAMTTSSKLFKKSYGKKLHSTLHSTTFGGIGSSCAVAIKTLEIITREDFMSDSNNNSDYLYDKLAGLAKMFPRDIIEIRGQGFYRGLQIRFPHKKMTDINLPYANKFEIACMGSIVRELFREYNILTFFTGAAPDVLHIMPPINTTKSEIDYFINSLTDLFEKNIYILLKKFIKGTIL